MTNSSTARFAATERVFVGGTWERAHGEPYDVLSPATGEPVARVLLPSAEDADESLARARAAFDDGRWSRLPASRRADLVEAFGAAFARRRREIDRAWVQESGPTAAHAAALNDAVELMWRDQVAHARALVTREVRDLPDGRVRVLREPVGVAVVVTTWNGPALYFAMKVVPALLAGCTVVVKTAVESQLTSRLIAECAGEAGLPAGVLSILAAPTGVSERLVADPRVDKVSLTGSVAAGRQVMAACAPHLTGLTLELGGKSPAIVVGDIAVDKVLPSFVPGFIAYQGQICAALTRLIVPKRRRGEFVEAVVGALSEMRVGDPGDPASDLGPLSSLRQYERVREYIAIGIAEGATPVLGGQTEDPRPGHYVSPTVFVDVEPHMRIAQEEIFGPVLCVLTYGDDEGEDLADAIALANGTRYGLAASVYADDEDVAADVAARLDSGTVSINTAGVSLFAPFGGTRQSGFGRENGAEGIAEFLRVKSVKLS
ncbi:aldehyde dehydrogenase family protein [Amycolatopsis sp. K13G38]|uniref:Aldehyde dehydrogenase family protein n=1 Tax=Amycolatopsis acididurans TaxID=2724524 RepID=A0ABX1JD99_9PSEU|nr:aldehyde dehydrogenase family protein [Amycolatopsis acididurans]NKQ57221.1 aldehyde dehydrogenase family protein [Amycolatopsis acididurans]